MKYFLYCYLIFLVVNYSHAQVGSSTQTDIKYFAQVMLHEAAEEDLSALEAGLKSNPYVFMVRLDRITNGLFIITRDIDTFDQSKARTWMGEYDQLIQCYRDGIHGIDEIMPFNLNFCNTINE